MYFVAFAAVSVGLVIYSGSVTFLLLGSLDTKLNKREKTKKNSKIGWTVDWFGLLKCQFSQVSYSFFLIP